MAIIIHFKFFLKRSEFSCICNLENYPVSDTHKKAAGQINTGRRKNKGCIYYFSSSLLNFT